MILRSLKASISEFESRSGWRLESRGACRGDVCLPLPSGIVSRGFVDIARLAEATGMPLVHSSRHEVWSLGPPSGGRALMSASAPPLILKEIRGGTFALESLRGEKVLLIAWASW